MVAAWNTYWYPYEMWNIEQRHNAKHPNRPERMKGSARMYKVFWTVWITLHVTLWPVAVILFTLDKVSGKKVPMEDVVIGVSKQFEKMDEKNKEDE